MILPILAYGCNVLRQHCHNIEPDFPNLDALISSMWETMYNANGCGLAAPQIGQCINLFVVDSKSTYESYDPAEQAQNFEAGDTGIIETFVNARIVARSERVWAQDEGCLSIPGLDGLVTRNWAITIEYQDQSFEKQIKSFAGKTARMIQHEYDHTQGILYLDYLKPLKRQLMESKLKKLAKGYVKPNYPMKFVKD
jgi:peptide deformylase